MSESIIIDGVNVAECEHLLYDHDKKRKPICKSGGSYRVYYSCLCVQNKDCHFKQLQRAKAENEELRFEKNLYKKTVQYMNELRYNETAEKYKTALKEIRESCNAYAKTEDFVIDQTFNEFLENIFLKINEVLKDE